VSRDNRLPNPPQSPAQAQPRASTDVESADAARWKRWLNDTGRNVEGTFGADVVTYWPQGSIKSLHPSADVAAKAKGLTLVGLANP
jgi:hypothetical protein